jgi:hypothetical protein
MLGLARDKAAGGAASVFANNGIKNENRCSVLLSLDYIPDLSNSLAGGATNLGKPTWERRADLGMRGIPPFRSRRADVLETPGVGENPQSP